MSTANTSTNPYRTIRGERAISAILVYYTNDAVYKRICYELCEAVEAGTTVPDDQLRKAYLKHAERRRIKLEADANRFSFRKDDAKLAEVNAELAKLDEAVNLISYR